MNVRLQQDLDHFFRVYQNNVNDTLHQKLPPAAAYVMEKELTEELNLLRTSVMNRLTQEINR